MRLLAMFVRLSASKITQKRVHGFGRNWMKDEPDPDHSPDAGTGLLSPISYALQREIILLRLENPTYRYWTWLLRARRSSNAWF